ncbi:MAG: SDR family oxidoreductase [Ignavibacteria bacterium]|nr:SDR family oxidoreductase [Ignavibacteria bacterium]
MTKTVLITGATTGIGYELAKLFAKDKYDLVIIARNGSKLKEVSDELVKDFRVNVKSISKDLSKTLSAEEIYQELNKENINIDVLINNAGFGSLGAFSESDLSNDLEMIQLNITSLVVLTKLFMSDMIRNNSGKIMNVASTAAFQPGPFMAIYYATKSFVLHFSEAIAEELTDTQITVTALCPGPVITEFQNRAGIQNTKLVNRKISGLMSAEEVAEIGFKGLMKGKRIVIPGIINKVIPLLVRLSPRKFVAKVAGSLHKE